MTAQPPPSASTLPAPPRRPVSRTLAAFIAFALGAQAAIQTLGTFVVALVRIVTPVDTARFNPAVLRIASGAAVVLALIYGCISVVYILGGLKLLKKNRPWEKYLLITAFVEAGLLLALNYAAVYIVTSVCCKISGMPYEEFQRTLNSVLAITISPAGCIGDVCFSVVTLGILIALIVLLFRLRKK